MWRKISSAQSRIQNAEFVVEVLHLPNHHASKAEGLTKHLPIVLINNAPPTSVTATCRPSSPVPEIAINACQLCLWVTGVTGTGGRQHWRSFHGGVPDYWRLFPDRCETLLDVSREFRNGLLSQSLPQPLSLQTTQWHDNRPSNPEIQLNPLHCSP